MKNKNKLLGFFLNPRIWFLLITIVIAIISTIFSTLILTQESFIDYIILGYIFLGIMIITIGYSIYGIIKITPAVQERSLMWSDNHPFWNKLFTQYGFRTIILSIESFLINIAFAIYNGAIAIVAGSIWFGSLSAYYILLILLRGGILLYHSRRRKDIKNGQTTIDTFKKDTKVYGRCGIVFILLPLALSFAILQMVRADDSFVHAGVTIYIYAIYAFYKISIAIFNFIKTRTTHEMTVRASKNINLADAMVSILALQTAMFHEFDTGDSVNVATMNAITGAVVCALTAFIGIFMIIYSNQIINKYKEKNDLSN